MKSITCCFTGHRIISDVNTEAMKLEIYNVCEKLVNRGITRFISGGAIGFDMLSAVCVLALKKKYPGVSLILIVPCADQSAKWNAQQKLMYEYIVENSDSIIVLHEKYVTGCMQERNKKMVDESSVCVAYLKRSYGGTKTTVDYAVSKELEVIYL